MLPFISRLFLRATNSSPVLRRSARAAKLRPRFEALEDRLTPNNRFVIPTDVPADNATTFHSLSQALQTPGLSSGNFVEIKQGATPGAIGNSTLPIVANLTIRGEAGVGASDLEPIVIANTLDIPAGRAGLTFQNLNLIANQQINVSAAATFSGNVLGCFGGISLLTTAGVTIVNNDITSLSANTLINVATAAGSHNLIAGNTLRGAGSSSVFVSYPSAGVTTDVIRDNILIGATGEDIAAMIFVGAGVDGLTIQRNLFRDADSNLGAILATDARNLKILQNTIEFAPTELAISVKGTSNSMTSAAIAGNIISVGSGSGAGAGIFLQAPTGGTFRIHVSANDILAATFGVLIQSSGAALNNVDLGGGTEGSPGGNNFRNVRTAAAGPTGAIFVNASAALGAVQARNNLFGAIGAEAAVFDNGDNSSLADAVTTGNLTGNAAFVQALFVRFLRRTGDVASPQDAGGFVNLLNAGVPATDVVTAISRSAEAMGLVVDDLFHSLLNRDADPAGRATWVAQLVAGATLESVKAGFFASPEYTQRFSGNRAFVASLYSKVLGRVGNEAEYQSWVALIPTLGRAGVASAILNSVEAHGQAAARLYLSLLKRAAAPAEIAGWANSGLDELSIQLNIAASAEGQGTT